MENFVVYKSSAGSGKTFTLVKEYLKLCLQTNNSRKFREILAITFTNKAASEMKSRIVEALQNLSSDHPKAKGLKQILMEEVALSEGELINRSQTILNNILHSYADFAVYTIDKFTYKLIRVFARELHIPINFEVELDQQALLKKVIDLLVDQVGKNAEITQILVDFVKSKTEEESNWHIEKDIFDFAKDLLGEKGEFHLPALRKLKISDFQDCRKAYVKQNKNYLKRLSELGSRALLLIDQNNIEYSAFSWGSIPKYFTCLKNSFPMGFKPNSIVVNSFSNAKLYPAKATFELKNKIDSIAAELTSIYEEAQEIIEKEHPIFVARLSAIKNIYSIALLNEIEKLFEKIKQEEGIIHISDFNKRIAEVVNSEPIPFIYERLGEKYKNYMVDEFQDTSLLQYQNLMPLLENALAENQFNMLVGDAKQAIYRWRGGEVEQFSAMPDYVHPMQKDQSLYVERQQNIRRHYKDKNLADNYRSSEVLVQFNNEFFHNLKPFLSPKLQQIFEGNIQGVKAEKDAGYVKLEFITKEKDLYEYTILQKVVGNIQDCLNDGYNMKDIAIVCRTKKNATLVADFLVANEIEVISSESLLLSSSPKVDFLVNLFHYILLPKNQKYQKSIVEYFVQQGHIRGGLHSNFEKWLKESEQFDSFFHSMQINFSINELIKLPLYEMCEKIVRIFNIHANYDLYVQFFMESVFNFHQRFGSGLSAFLEWWEENSEKLFLDVPEKLDAVKIMTIHKSKGLEFPIVIYPFADYKVNNGKSSIWLKVNERLQPSLPSMVVPCVNDMLNSIYKDEITEELDNKLMDMMNETYVAFTRAAKRLYVYTKELPKTSKEINSLNLLIDKSLQHFPEYSASEGLFERGKATSNSKTDSSIVEKSDLEAEFISMDWHDRLSISMEAPADWHSTDTSTARQYGNLIHQLLSEISTIEDLENVISEYKLKGLIIEDEMPELKTEISAILKHPGISAFFEKGLKLKREEALLTPQGESYRPDRVVFRDNVVQVIDYKSGLKDSKHELQLKNYMELIQTVENKPTEAYLIYLNELQVLRVS